MLECAAQETELKIQLTAPFKGSPAPASQPTVAGGKNGVFFLKRRPRPPRKTAPSSLRRGLGWTGPDRAGPGRGKRAEAWTHVSVFLLLYAFVLPLGLLSISDLAELDTSETRET